MPVRILRIGGTALSGAGETLNVGSRGVLFTADQRLEVGASIEYAITLPPASGSSDGMGLRCLGKVLRYEGNIDVPDSRAKQYVMAATIERHEFLRE